MAERNRATLKGFFTTGSIPTQANFSDLIDSFHNKSDDPIGPLGGYVYHAASANADTIGDWRQYGDADGFYVQYCTVGNATKGEGTWITKFTVQV